MGGYTNKCILCTFTNAYISINTYPVFILGQPYRVCNYTRYDVQFFTIFYPYKGNTAFLAYIPHYTFEIMGLCVIASGLYILNQAIIRKITNLFKKRKKENYFLKQAITNLAKTYLLVSLPLIILAAFTETYIANFLLNLMN